MHPLRPRSVRVLLQGVLAASTLLAVGCEEDEGPGKLFEESGTWALTRYALEGSGLRPIDNQRSESFLLDFDPTNRVVTTAMCAANEDETPANATCSATGGSQWFCQCYAYAFEEEQMAWLQFEAGAEPPMVQIGEDADPPAGGDTDTDTEGDSGEGGGDEEEVPSGTQDVFVSEVAGAADTYDFTPLPIGVFGSDGLVSKFIFVKRSSVVFNQVYENNDNRGVCEPCVP